MITINKKYFNNKLVMYLCCIFIAILIFILVYGYKVLNVVYDDWILYRCDDLTQSYLGWKAYRKSGWNVPIGMIDDVVVPFKLSIYYTDSIPIACFILKLFSCFLPIKCQFYGIYGLICFILSGIFTARILSKYIQNNTYVILSVGFVLLLSVIYERMFTHTALASHWIIIYGLYYIFNYKFDKKISISFLTIFPILSSSIHLYFLPMNFIIIFAYAILCSFYNKKVYYFFIIIASYILISFIIVYMFGGFDTIGNFADTTIGNTTLNLNSAIQSFGRSKFIGALPTHTLYPGENFIYVGIGGIIIILVSLLDIVFVHKFHIIFYNNKILVLLFCFMIITSIIVSVLPHIYFNEVLILDVKFSGIIKSVFDIFRSNARFIWIGYYTCILATLIILGKNFNIIIAICIIATSVLLQVVDYFDTLKILHNYYAYNKTYKASIDNVVFKGSMNLYDAFGVELGVGYVGGHGTAGTLGNTLREIGASYADVSQGVGTTTATFGIVGGIIIGIILINWAARSGETALLKKPADIPMPIRVGFEKDPSKQGSCGRETTMSSSIDTYAFHAAVIFMACGAAYFIVKMVKAYKVPFLSDFSVWAYGMIVMFIIWGIMCALKIDYLADGKVKGHITGPFTEFAVIGAIASLPLKAVAAYLVPIVVMCILGYIVTTLVLMVLCKYFLKGCWFEQMIGTFGMATGVFITGVLLLRICDPDGETPALSTYSMSYTVMSCVYFVFLDRFIKMSASGNVMGALIMSFVVGVICVIFTIVSSKICFGKIDTKNNAAMA